MVGWLTALPVPVSDLLLELQTKDFRLVHQKHSFQRSMPSPGPNLLWKPPGSPHLYLWALSPRPSPFCSTPINFHSPLGISQIHCRTHLGLVFPEHSSLYIHSANLQKTPLASRRALSSITHFRQTFTFSPVIFITFGRCCLQTLAESYPCLLSNLSSISSYAAYQIKSYLLIC